LATQEAEYSFSGFIPTNKYTNKYKHEKLLEKLHKRRLEEGFVKFIN